MNSEGQGTSAPALDPKSLKERARLPSPSEQDSMFIDLLNEVNAKLLAERKAAPKD